MTEPRLFVRVVHYVQSEGDPPFNRLTIVCCPNKLPAVVDTMRKFGSATGHLGAVNCEQCLGLMGRRKRG